MQHADFVHLHVHSQYSLLDGAIRFEEMLALAKKYQMGAVALTDHGNMFGVVEFYQKAIQHGVKPIVGCEVYVAPGVGLTRKQGWEKRLSFDPPRDEPDGIFQSSQTRQPGFSRGVLLQTQGRQGPPVPAS